MEFRISIKKKTKKHPKIGPGMLYSKSINIFNHIHRDSIYLLNFRHPERLLEIDTQHN